MTNDEKSIEIRILSIIDKIRPFLISDGGDIEFIKYENNTVYVKLTGACANCSILDVTLKGGIEQILINEIPEIKEVINVNDNEF